MTKYEIRKFHGVWWLIHGDYMLGEPWATWQGAMTWLENYLTQKAQRQGK